MSLSPRASDPNLSQLPDRPGVYLFRDGQAASSTSGKARSIRKRVANYFGAPSGLEARTQALVAASRAVEWVVVAGEVQALMLEFSLIQEHRPRYNVRYSDDKSYPYLAVTTEREVAESRGDARIAPPGREVLRPVPERLRDPRDGRSSDARLPDAHVLRGALQRVRTG